MRLAGLDEKERNSIQRHILKFIDILLVSLDFSYSSKYLWWMDIS